MQTKWNNPPPSPGRASLPRLLVLASAAAFACLPGFAQAPPEPASAAAAAPAPAPAPQVLDSVVAVVNNQVILASDLDLELRIFRLLPIGARGDATRSKALERLTTRALIEQQILQEDSHGLEVAPKELEDSLEELRQSLPACRRRDCASAAGWSNFLQSLGLTQEQVSEYWARRMAVLRFIELRFRSGIRISPEEIATYYRETLTPKYARPEDAPPLAKIAPRIQEVLLQQQVNTMLNEWLKTLQDQGQVEVLDPTLKAEAAKANAPEPLPGPTAAPEKGGGP